MLSNLIRKAQLESRIRLASGLVLFSFVLTHFLNHALGNISLSTLSIGRDVFITVWRSNIGQAVLLTAISLHVVLVLARFARRRSLKFRRSEWVQLCAGIGIPLLLASHYSGTHMANTWYGVEDTYVYEIWSTWVNQPWEAVLLLGGLVFVWCHGVLGLHFWLRLKPWYPRAFPWLLALAVAIPALAISGYLGASKQVALLALDKGWLQAQITEMRLPADLKTAAQRIYDFAAILRYTAIGIVALAGLTWAGRQLWLLMRKRIAIHYTDGHRAVIEVGSSVLEASQLNNIPHASICGGRGRCSTCRVRIVAGAAHAGDPSPEEQAVLQRIGAGEGVRLACQLRPSGDITVALLLPPTVQVQESYRRSRQSLGSEREIAILFADLRSFTKFSESKLPYDVVFALNQYFRAMGTAVEVSGGRLDKFIGDGVMALFGIDDGKARGCRNALRCAREMSIALRSLNEQLAENLNEPFRMGIGIHSGPAIVGEMGFRDAVSLTAVGDSVNTASRLENLTKEFGAQLIVSEDVVKAAGLDLSEFPLEIVAVRGRATGLPVRIVGDAAEIGLPLRSEASVYLDPGAA